MLAIGESRVYQAGVLDGYPSLPPRNETDGWFCGHRSCVG